MMADEVAPNRERAKPQSCQCRYRGLMTTVPSEAEARSLGGAT